MVLWLWLGVYGCGKGWLGLGCGCLEWEVGRMKGGLSGERMKWVGRRRYK